jgi:hypothetical protein
MFAGLGEASSPVAVVDVQVLRGPMARVPAYVTAFLCRHRRLTRLFGATTRRAG